MEGKSQKIISTLLVLLLCTGLSAQQKSEQKDSLVRLIKAKSLELIEKGNVNYRKTIDATFFHNNTYFICDTALWNVDSKIINAWGNVRVVQEGTILTSDKMDYLIDDNLVQARGTLVQLEDKDHNTLRTHYLDYNTKDSLAYFSRGAAMKDKDGQIIESSDGSYDAKQGLFQFQTNVNMFTDSIFIRSSRINYESRVSRAIFPERIDFWKDDNMLSADRGWYERLQETFFFNGRVHATSKEQEAWCDSLYYYRTPNNLLMLNKVQVQDTTRNAFALANRLFYEDSLKQVTISREAAVALRTEDKIMGADSVQRVKVDTIYIGADTLVYWTERKCDIPESVIKESEDRLEEIHSDPVTEYRRKALKAAEEAAKKAAEENAESNPLLAKGKRGPGGKDGGPEGAGEAVPEGEEAPPEAAEEPPAEPEEPSAEPEAEDALLPAIDTVKLSPEDSLAKVALDSIAKARADSIHVADSIANLPPPDTTRIGFAVGVGNVKIFRTDIQVACDSMRFTELDSVARFYINPIVWNEGNRQYSADSIGVLVNSAGIDRASLMSNAFIITQETPTLFDQIRATEVMAYFDSTSALRRFDAMGGANGIFYLKEKEQFATVNKVDSKMLSAWFQDGELQTIHYFDSPKNNAYPLPQLKEEDRTMKGFNWDSETQPKGKEDITDLKVRLSQRREYAAHPRASFRQTDIYFPGYMKKVYAAIEAAKNKPKPAPKPAEAPVEEADSLLTHASDSLRTAAPEASSPELPDSLRSDSTSTATPDSLRSEVPDSLRNALPDSLRAAIPDSLKKAGTDSLAVKDTVPVHVPSKYEIRKKQQEEKAAAREAAYQARIAARDARWAIADSLDAAKAALKAEKIQARKDARAERVLEKRIHQEEVDAKKLEKFVERYRKKYEKQKAREARKAAKMKPAGDGKVDELQAEPVDESIIKPNIDNGEVTGQISEVRPYGHPKQRGIGESTVNEQAAEPAETPVQ